MTNHVQGRLQILNALREELVGPSPQGEEIDLTQPAVLPRERFNSPCRQKGSGEEILQQEAPVIRYGVGVLYPLEMNRGDTGVLPEQHSDESQEVTDVAPDLQESKQPDEDFVKLEQNLDKIRLRSKRGTIEEQQDDFDLSTANARWPSSMAVSFIIDISEINKVIVELPTHRPNDEIAVNGRYEPVRVGLQEMKVEKTWWLRRPVSARFEFKVEDFKVNNEFKRVLPSTKETSNLNDLNITVEVFSRRQQDLGPDIRLLTVSLINRTLPEGGMRDEYSLFQSYFHVFFEGVNSACVLPYHSYSRLDEEEKVLALLYHATPTFAVGHGCAADWQSNEEGIRATKIIAECLPTFETPSITPDIELSDGRRLTVAMADLAGLTQSDGMQELEDILRFYATWIDEKRDKVATLPADLQTPAQANLRACEDALVRMRDGFRLLETDPLVKHAFELANHAMLLQQLRSGGEIREAKYDKKSRRLRFTLPYPNPDPLNPGPNRGTWRAFQIAFLLLSIKSIAQGDVPDRDIVDLIWFPTGGGKTEAYLGLTAFTIFLRRLRDKGDVGVSVLMRYTLRLLTAQQFQRASALICAMEILRLNQVHVLGDTPITSGIWVGGETTPNTREQAVNNLRDMSSRSRDSNNRMLLDQCPWCRAQLGPVTLGPGAPSVLGYQRSGSTVVFCCPDQLCDFHRGIPVVVIDEDIYDNPPALIIGTVDKFAQLAWRDEIRALFGINTLGERYASPPNLIIQDELHLISGPLGSMVGLYEAIIEELCTDRRYQSTIKPKIICSTATIRNYKEQVLALYARCKSALFPPPGLDAADSFFAKYATKPNGELSEGRLYVGVLGPGLGSLQTAQIRTYASLLQSVMNLPEEARDPWWTLFGFFNSLNELGNTLSLFQVNIPVYFESLKRRFGKSGPDLRKFYNILELTGRLSNDELPKALASLEVAVSTGNKSTRAVDVCLASNIIEVGIDIDRLSLMAVAGQPKTTAQYIQVTGRVGRRWYERPGLVVTVYSPTRARDRSHYEKFRTYHQKLYAQVEPTSVTPFSPPALDRALHAVMVAFVRQTEDTNTIVSPFPFPNNPIESLRQLLLPRVKAVDSDELDNFTQVFDKRARQWEQWKRVNWRFESQYSRQEDIPLLYAAGQYMSDIALQRSWSTPTSMRNVDAECKPRIIELNLEDDEVSHV